MFFRKARFHSTKGLLTQRNAKKKKNNFWEPEKLFFCDRTGSFDHWFSGDKEDLQLCPRFHRGSARKHILSNLIFAWRNLISSQQGTLVPATLRKTIFQSLKNCFSHEKLFFAQGGVATAHFPSHKGNAKKNRIAKKCFFRSARLDPRNFPVKGFSADFSPQRNLPESSCEGIST